MDPDSLWQAGLFSLHVVKISVLEKQVEIDEIKTIISQGIPSAEVVVEGDGHHYQAVVIAAGFEQKSAVQRHQMVYKTLGNRAGNEIHAE